MKVVIDIDDELYKEYVHVQLARGNGKSLVSKLLEAVKKGIPLPEHHEIRYKPIVLQEHDAEPRALRAILDTATDEIYICRLTRQGAELLGMTIEEVNVDE